MRRAIGFSLLMLTACVAPQQVAPPPLPAPTPTPSPAPQPPPADWRDRAPTPGDWSYAREGGLSEARYAVPGSAPLLAFTCDPRALQIRLTWPGATAGAVTIRTSYGDVTRPAQQSEVGVQIAFAARDPLLDQIVFSRGRFMMEAGGQGVIVPAWPEVARVVEDCR